MSFNKLIRGYVESNQAETVEETYGKRTSWLRKLAAPAAVGLSLGFGLMQLVACGGEDPAVSEDDSAQTDDGKADKTGGKTCTTNKQCGIGQYCKKAAPGPIITPKYGITPNIVAKYGIIVPTSCKKDSDCKTAGQVCVSNVCQDKPIITPKYGITPVPTPTPTKGKCAPLPESMSDADCADTQTCIGAVPAKKSSCPAGAYCILPPNPTPAQPGICMNECKKTNDCAKGETCTEEKLSNVGSNCPAGAYCILPPSPTVKVCEMKVYAILPPTK